MKSEMKMFRLPGFQLLLAESDLDAIQLFRVGVFHHPTHGKLEITKEMLSEIKSNFEKRVRGIDIAIDYKHDSDNVAAGWVKELYLSDAGDALFAKVNWTPTGSKIIQDKEFRYVSPEFTLNYVDNENLSEHGPTLLGAGLTNRPVIKKMEPVVELAEFVEPKVKPTKKTFSETNKNPKGDLKMDDLSKLSPEQLIAMVESLKAELEKLKADAGTFAAEKAKMIGDHAKVAAELSETKKKGDFTKLLSEGKVCAAQEEAFLKGDMAKFAELAKPVKLSETGVQGTAAGNTTIVSGAGASSDDKVIEAAEKLVQDKKFSNMGDAISHVLKLNLKKQ